MRRQASKGFGAGGGRQISDYGKQGFKGFGKLSCGSGERTDRRGMRTGTDGKSCLYCVGGIGWQSTEMAVPEKGSNDLRSMDFLIVCKFILLRT